MRLFRCVALLVLGVAFVRPASSEVIHESWDIVLLNGSRVGYNHSVISKVAIEGKETLVTETLGHLALKRAGQELVTNLHIHSVDTPDGQILKFTSTLSNPPSSEVVVSGRSDGTSLLVEVLAAGQSIRKTIPGVDRLKSQAYVDHYILEGKLVVDATAEFEVFDPQLAKVVTIKLTRQPPQKTTLWNDEERVLDQILLTNSGIPGAVTRIAYDSKTGQSLKTSVDLIGMQTFAVSKEEALREFDLYDQLVDTMIPLKTQASLTDAAEVAYRVVVDGEIEATMFPAGPFQKVERKSDSDLLVTVRRALIPEGGADSSSPEPGAEFLSPSRFIECDDHLIVELAAKATEGADEAEQKVFALERFVRSHVNNRNLQTAMATALEVAKTQAGDCTEHAVLLAALLRAEKIPSRVAMGVVHVPSQGAFIGHMWTEAWVNGQWMPLDGTRARRGTTCEYIKLSDSALAGDGAVPGAEFLPLAYLFGRTKIELVKVTQ
ncbi:MAG: transglutaminase family protein [Planctomycetaceae bacterium]|nr:transglutaminase family protein [Planctomycetaceae bacterium]